LRTLLDLVVQLLMALIAIFMIVWGGRLVEVTWHNTIADFPFLSVGVTYLPIPVGGVCLLLFIVERIFARGAPRSAVSHFRNCAVRLIRQKPKQWISLFCSRPCWSAFSSACPSPIRWRFAAIAGAWSNRHSAGSGDAEKSPTASASSDC